MPLQHAPLLDRGSQLARPKVEVEECLDTQLADPVPEERVEDRLEVIRKLETLLADGLLADVYSTLSCKETRRTSNQYD